MKNFIKIRKTGLVIAAIAALADQYTKWLALENLREGSLEILPGFFHFTLAFNRGVSFSFLGGIDTPIHLFGHQLSPSFYMPAALGLFALAASLFFIHWLGSSQKVLFQTSVGLILGGAVGNLIDRVNHGVVVDFLHFFYGNYHFPAFNVADSAICVGVALLLWDSMGQPKNGKKKR